MLLLLLGSLVVQGLENRKANELRGQTAGEAEGLGGYRRAGDLSQWHVESHNEHDSTQGVNNTVSITAVAHNSEAQFTVREALRLLQPLQSSRTRSTGQEKSLGFFATTFQYAKTAFVFLFFNGPKNSDSSSSSQSLLPKPLNQAVRLLDAAARDGEPDAIFLIAEMNFFGNYSHPRNFTEAFRRYHQLATLNGNSSAQHMVGIMYATGIGGVVERDQGKALMYETFAAKGGSTRAQMATAYRHYTGVGAPRNCSEAAFWYKRVADKAIAYYRSGPPDGISLTKDSYKIADEKGGVYGEGASVVSSGINAIHAGPNSDQHASFDDVLEYLDLMSRKGELKATLALGRLHYEGNRTLRKNFRTARAYFTIVTRRYWKKDGTANDEDHSTAKFAAKAAAYLGQMFLRGEGVEQSYDKALFWFKRGLSNGDALSQYEMGLMYLHGYGVRKDAIKASELFKEAANQDLSSAQVALGQLYLDQGDVGTAIRFFDLAARIGPGRNGHIEAFYHLAEMSNKGIGRDRSCNVATAFYKLVAEKVETIHSSFDEANRAYEDDETETALITYMLAAEQGYETAQSNVAYLLDEHHSVFSLGSFLPWRATQTSLLKNAVLALIYWTRSAKQLNIDSLVKMGDYYLGGYGTEADMQKAATCYQEAAQTHQSAQALWNLGWMHENGIGVEQDFHLAKRFYDSALETNMEAYLPVKLSLTKLRLRSFWNTITKGKVNSIQSEPGKPPIFHSEFVSDLVSEPSKDWSFKEWVSNFLEDQHPYYHGAEDEYYDDPVPDHGMPGGDADYYDEIDEGFIDSLIIVCLAGALAFLIYYRQQRQHNRARAHDAPADGQPPPPPVPAQVPVPDQTGVGQAGQQQHPPQPQPGQQPDGGFFPPANDPNFNQWVAGEVGH